MLSSSKSWSILTSRSLILSPIRKNVVVSRNFYSTSIRDTVVASAAASVPEAPSEICISQASIIMGIKDLLKELRSITTVRHLSEYKGLRAGVDIMCWIHKGIHRCIDELINGEETDAYVTYCMELISLLKQHEIFPYIVLDGRKLQAKREKNLERKQCRDENRNAAHEATNTARPSHTIHASTHVESKHISKTYWFALPMFQTHAILEHKFQIS